MNFAMMFMTAIVVDPISMKSIPYLVALDS
jgi:hypothetical protein